MSIDPKVHTDVACHPQRAPTYQAADSWRASGCVRKPDAGLQPAKGDYWVGPGSGSAGLTFWWRNVKRLGGLGANDVTMSMND